MTHPLVLQLRFTRSEFRRALAGITDEDARRRFDPMNCISWNIAHLGWHEQRTFISAPTGGEIFQPIVNEWAGYGKPATTPPLDEAWAAWTAITARADAFLETLTPETLTTHLVVREKKLPESIGSQLWRVIYHYWYHIGENMAIRQMLGHTNLPEFIGAIHAEAPYTPE